MLFVIQGRKYPADSLQDISLADMLAVKRQTGMSMTELDAALNKLVEESSTTEGGPGMESLDDASLFALATMIWLARRHAGEKSLTLEEAADFPLRELSMEAEPGDLPNRPARRARAAKKAPATKRASAAAKRTPATGGRTRTSKTPSGPA
jgi:hypothetical protein